MRMVLVGATLVGLTIGACSGSGSDVPATSPADGADAGADATTVTPAGAVTFHKDALPILQKVCQNCHIAGGIAPFSLVSYADAQAVAGAIVAQTASRTMPPWGAQTTAECQPPHAWKDDLRLSEQDIATLKAWHDGGDLEGDPKDAPPPRAAKPTGGLAGATSLTPAAPFTVAGTKDAFRCYVLDPNITTTKYLNGTNFVPSNKTVVHHALTYAIPKGTAVPGDSYECFGGPNVEGSTLVAAWAPGGVPNEYPADVGLPVEPGTRFIMQVHYHPHANATPEPDATTFQFRLTDTAPSWVAQTRLIGNFNRENIAPGIGLEPGMNDPSTGAAFSIPAGKAGHIETMKFVMPSIGPKGLPVPPLRILGLGAHMHLAGRDQKITITKGSAAPQCLLQVPAWDFNWQRGYQYDTPMESLPLIVPGDTLQVRCTYDNTMQNRALATALAEQGNNQPKDIALGESTLDEMCLGSFLFLYKAK